MSSMEPDVKRFFIKIINVISVALLWMLVNSTVGIGLKFALFEYRPTLKNYIFYAWFLLSLTGLIIYFYKKWKG